MIDSIYFRDPNGYVIELCAKRADHDAQMDPASNGARATLERWTAGKARRRPERRSRAGGIIVRGRDPAWSTA